MPDTSINPQDKAINQLKISENFRAFLQKSENRVSFRDFMEYSLYDPAEGYYTSASRTRVGKEGDFITSISVGKTFATLIIERLKRILHGQASFTFIELGPEGGTFAKDFLAAWDSSICTLTHYYGVERSPEKCQNLNREIQHPAFSAVADIPKTNSFVILFANEVLDAFPVHLIELTPTGWKEVFIKADNDYISEELASPSTPRLKDIIATLPADLPTGYRTEVNLDYLSFFKDLAINAPNSHHLFIDYFLSEEEYYAPHRTEGTLQTYYQHQKSVSPYYKPGLVDLSCHVNYSTISSAAQEAGLSCSRPISQGQYLTTHAKDWLLKLSPSAPNFQKTINEFKTLTMPNLFGAKFQVIEIKSRT